MRLPLMGVLKKLQATRLASQLAFMMIEYIRRDAVVDYGARRGEIGWILEDNQGMRSIAEAIDSKINKIYRIYERALYPSGAKCKFATPFLTRLLCTTKLFLPSAP